MNGIMISRYERDGETATSLKGVAREELSPEWQRDGGSN